MAYKLKKQENLKRQERLNRKNKLLKRVTFTFLIGILILIIWIIFIRNRITYKKYDNEYLNFNYDSTWTLSKDDKNYIALTNKTNSIVTFKVLNLTSKNSNSSVEMIADEIKYDIESENKTYKLLKQESDLISSNKYECYKFLYENGNEQSMVIVIKNDNNIYIVNYTSNNKTFDIVLDSFQYILGSIKLK